MKLKDKTAIITGAGSGIGEASAKLFAREGARVVATDINPEAGQQVVQQIKKEGGEATFLQVDVSLATDAERMIQTAISFYGRLDILFNNAGVPGETLEETTEEKWRRVIDVNLTGPFLACQYAAPIMKKQGSGNIINTASTGGLKATGRSPAYTASKGGLVLLTKALAKSLGKDGIRVNCICPGLVETGLTDAFLYYPITEAEKREKRDVRIANTPISRLCTSEDIASAALFLASDESSFINGIALVVDGGTLA